MLELASCAAVIPCFNEGATIAALVRAARRHLSAVIVVNDGSTDNTAVLAQRAGATVLNHARNLGKGTALKTGLSCALNQGCEWALTMDGDGQHAPADALALLECAGLSGALLVVGNRMHQAHAMPWLRRKANRWMSRKLSQRAGKFLPDTQSGFRLIHLRTWAALPLNAERFEVESEMLMAFIAADCLVAFVPIQVIAPGRPSHIRPVADTLRWWKWWRGFKHPRNLPAGIENGLRDNLRPEFTRVLIP
jgi:glycosyltransferase involved in cell wall biosynthesis